LAPWREREIFEQEWFNDIDLQALIRDRNRGVPVVRPLSDTSCFDGDHVKTRPNRDIDSISEADRLFGSFLKILV
jgi:hypothetical protein